MTRWSYRAAAVGLSGLLLAGCASSNDARPVVDLFGGMSAVDGSGLLGPVIHHKDPDVDGYAHLAFLEVVGDPTQVWLDYQELLAQTYQVQTPSSLEACVQSSGAHSVAYCDLRGTADSDTNPVSIEMRMWQPRKDFVGRYVIKISVSPATGASDESSESALTPYNDPGKLEKLPAARGANATPPQTGEQIGNGLLNSAYSLPLSEGVTVVRNLESGLGVDGISAYLQVSGNADAVAVAEETADQLCEAEPAVQWEYDEHTFTYLECPGVAGDNPGDFYVIETPSHGTYIYFFVYID